MEGRGYQLAWMGSFLYRFLLIIWKPLRSVKKVSSESIRGDSHRDFYIVVGFVGEGNVVFDL